MMDLIFIFKEETGFPELWNTFISSSKNVTYRYTLLSIKYNYIYSSPFVKEDLSFIILKDNIPLAIIPLFLEQREGKLQFSRSCSYQLSPLQHSDLNSKQQKRIERICFQKIDELAKKLGASKAMFMVDPFNVNSHNVLRVYDYLDTTINTSIIVLSNSLEMLWTNLRRRYKAYINKGKKFFNISIMDYNNPDYSLFQQYRKLHHKASGRITRSLETFDLQFEMLKRDNGLLVGLQKDNKFIAFSYFCHHNGSAYFGSASNDPDYKIDIPLEHCIIWSAIEYYKRRKFNLFEVGWQHYSIQLFDIPNEKDKNISFFKRGFGGDIVNLYRGIKYYDSTLMRDELQTNIQSVIIKYGE